MGRCPREEKIIQNEEETYKKREKFRKRET